MEENSDILELADHDVSVDFPAVEEEVKTTRTTVFTGIIKPVFLISDTLSNKISYYHLLLLLFSLPFDLFYSHLILISFGIHTLINVNKERFWQVFTLRTLMLQSVFWLTLIGLSYSIDKGSGVTVISRQLVIFCAPIFFSMTILDLKKYRNNLLLGFSLCSVGTIVYLYLEAFRVIHFYKYPVKALFSDAFTNHNFSDTIGMHATFLSLQIGLAFIYVVSRLIKQNGGSGKRLFFTFCCALLFLGLLQLGSKSVCAAILVALTIAVPVFLWEDKRTRTLFVITSLLIIMVAGLAASRSQSFKNRFFNTFKDDVSQKINSDLTDPRLLRWKVASGLIIKSPLTGYGSGAEIGLLKNEYFNKKLYNSFLHGLNAHNEYLSMLLATGILGLMVYLGTLYYGFKNALKARDLIYLTFTLLIIIVSLSENVLDVDKGTMFYGLFFSFFALTKNTVPGAQTQ